MKLNFTERLLVNNPVRALVQRFYEIPLLRKLGGSVEDARVLEVGCGRGEGLALLLDQFHASHVCGIDLDPEQIARARKHLAGKYDGRFELTTSSVDKLPFANASFDAVFDFGVLHHVPVWQAGIAEIRRVLKPGGTFFFEEVTRAALQRWLYRRFLEHPTQNRFDEADFANELRAHELTPTCPLRRILFGDIFIGAAKLLTREMERD
jgi:ubiquinone/menaquinone biosynthesis C-methylase UbiE